MYVYVSPDLKGWSYPKDHEEKDWIKVKPVISIMTRDFDLHLVRVRGEHLILEATDDGFLVFKPCEYLLDDLRTGGRGEDCQVMCPKGYDADHLCPLLVAENGDQEMLQAVWRIYEELARSEKSEKSDFERFEEIKRHLQATIALLKQPFNNVDPELTRARIREIRRYLEEIEELLDTFNIDG